MLRIRPASPDDADAILAIYAPVVHDTVISFETSVPTVSDIVARMTVAPRLPWLLAELNGHVAGYAYAAKHRERGAYRWSVDTSVYVGSDARGSGVGSALYRRLLPLLGELNYASAYAGIALPNPASVGLHEALGFQRIGMFPRVGYKQGSWRDVGWWWRALADLDDQPPEPRPWTGA